MTQTARRSPGADTGDPLSSKGKRAAHDLRRSAASALLLLLLLLCAAAQQATALHEGEFIHTSKRSQYLQVCSHRDRKAAGGWREDGTPQTSSSTHKAFVPPPSAPPPTPHTHTHPFSALAPQQMRTNWRDLTEHHCPRFGKHRTVALPILEPKGAAAEVRDYRIQLSFDGDRLVTPWIPVIGGRVMGMPLVRVELRRVGGELKGVRAEVGWVGVGGVGVGGELRDGLGCGWGEVVKGSDHGAWLALLRLSMLLER